MSLFHMASSTFLQPVKNKKRNSEYMSVYVLLNLLNELR